MSPHSAEVCFFLDSQQDIERTEDTLTFHYLPGIAQSPSPWKRGRPKGSTGKPCTSRNKWRQYSFVRGRPQPKQARGGVANAAPQDSELVAAAISDVEFTNKYSDIDYNDTKAPAQILARFNLLQITGVDPFNMSCIELKPYMHDALVRFNTFTWKKIYPLENMVGYNPFADYWLPMAFHDSALIHCFIWWAEKFGPCPTEKLGHLRVDYHLQQVVSIMNRRLSDESNISSPETISVVAGMAIAERGFGRIKNWQIHLRGLKYLVDHRGGPESLETVPVVLHKIFKADLCGSIEDLQPTILGELVSTSVLRQNLASIEIGTSGFVLLHEKLSLTPFLQYCIQQLWSIAEFWTDIPDEERRRPATRPSAAAQVAHVRQTIRSVQYILLSLETPQQSPISHREFLLELCRVALLFYTITLVDERTPGVPYGEGIGRNFRTTLAVLFAQGCETSLGVEPMQYSADLPLDFIAWALFLASNVIRTIAGDVDNWIRTSFHDMGIKLAGKECNFQELLRCISRYLWVPSIHEDLLRRTCMTFLEGNPKEFL